MINEASRYMAEEELKNVDYSGYENDIKNMMLVAIKERINNLEYDLRNDISEMKAYDKFKTKYFSRFGYYGRSSDAAADRLDKIIDKASDDIQQALFKALDMILK